MCVIVCAKAIGNYLDKLYITLKRVSPVPIARNTDNVIESRHEYAVNFSTLIASQAKIFFADETGIQVCCRTGYGRAKAGKRANIEVKAIRGKNYSVCAAMNSECLYYYSAQDSAFNAQKFCEFLNELFELFDRDNLTGVTLVMDNVRFHHVDTVLETVSRKGHHLLFLPAYSPFLNPIENLFNQLKHYVKKLRPSDANAIFYALEHASDAISSADCVNYYRNMSKYLQLSLNRQHISN